MWKEFKEFAFKGNVLDMAVGVIIGGAFGKIVSSVVNDLIMPLFGYVTSGMDFSQLVLQLSPDASIKYGAFIQNVIDFLIIAVSIFLFIRLINKAREKLERHEEAVEQAEEAAAPTTEELLAEIRDLLRQAETAAAPAVEQTKETADSIN